VIYDYQLDNVIICICVILAAKNDGYMLLIWNTLSITTVLTFSIFVQLKYSRISVVFLSWICHCLEC